MSSMWSCDWDGCGLPAVEQAGDCELCNRHLCRLHLQEPWHECPDPNSNWTEYCSRSAAARARNLDELRQRIDGVKLCERASQVRGTNVPCAIDLSPASLAAMRGGQNCHAQIKFEDGIVWLARFRILNVIAPPPELCDSILESEALTMQFLGRHTRVPSPRVFDWACESDPTNTIGVGYILMEKLNGTPLDWQRATVSQKEKISLGPANTVSREQAFASPKMMWPVNPFHDGSNELTEEELLLARVFREGGREDLASCVLHGRKVQILLFALHAGVAELDKKTFVSLFVGLKRAFDEQDVKTDGQGVEDEWEVWNFGGQKRLRTGSTKLCSRML
ncbi:hypothetical protein E4U52_003960 [Claviceps spartinae]|nr:hypothetical protein E4U52_003960 [Claviceps spartinae]